MTDTLANYIATFLQKERPEIENGPLKLGFIFGFPVEKSAINHGKILAWSKGFSVKDAVGKDVAELLQDAINRKQLPVQCQAIVNDVREKPTGK
jgi:hexokinase